MIIIASCQHSWRFANSIFRGYICLILSSFFLKVWKLNFHFVAYCVVTSEWHRQVCCWRGLWHCNVFETILCYFASRNQLKIHILLCMLCFKCISKHIFDSSPNNSFEALELSCASDALFTTSFSEYIARANQH